MAIVNSHQSNIVSDIQTNSFTLEANAHVFKMLTTNIYSDTILAPIRELSTNAVDATLEANSLTPFHVHLPTESEPFFSVRDFGSGMDPQVLTSFYTTMGASSKRDSNTYNGQFGIGKLAPLAYASSFTVESFYAGLHHTYLISIADGIPCYTHLSSLPSDESSGLHISIPVQLKDIPKFVEKAQFLYRFFSTRPTTNLPLTYQAPTLSGSDWCI